jgi:hypothetical protein
MFVDNPSGLPLPAALDLKVEKKTEVEEPRPIKGSDGSDDARLDLQRQNTVRKITERRRGRRDARGGRIYNSKGTIEKNPLSGDPAASRRKSVEFEI